MAPAGAVPDSRTIACVGSVQQKAFFTPNRRFPVDSPTSFGLIVAKSRGTAAAPVIVQNGDLAGGLFSTAYDGANYKTLASILFPIDGEEGISVRVRDVYAWVCPEDGEASFTPEMVDELIVTVRELIETAKRAKERRSSLTEYVVAVG